MTVKQTVALFTLLPLAALAPAWFAQAANEAPSPRAVEFDQKIKPFLAKNCVRCHNADNPIAGIKVDQLDAKLEDRHLSLWEHVQGRVGSGSMPPKGQPQPTAEERAVVTSWIKEALQQARLRPSPKNGIARRLTVAQYRNTLRDVLKLDDDFSELLPPDAISKDGFVNNKETLQLNPLLLEAYLEIAEEALSRSIVDPAKKPQIQNFRMDLGAGINKNPLPESLILGANSLLLDNKDFTVTQLTATKPFPFEPFFMRTKYRFIEGYQGNDTVRGWREYDSIYHSVFACMRGSRGYPKGLAYTPAPEGLLLRPAIPNDEIFTADGTYGPKANFKISLRELPDHGRFRVTVTAAKYDDGLLLDPGELPAAASASALTITEPKRAQVVNVKQAGVYQIDVHAAPRGETPPAPDASRLTDSLGVHQDFNNLAAKAVDSPFGKAATFNGSSDEIKVPRTEGLEVGERDFTLAFWMNPKQLKRAGLVGAGEYGWNHGWYLEMPDNKGVLKFETTGPDNQSNGAVTTPPGVVRANAWQHVAVVARRGKLETKIYLNGYLVGSGEIGSAKLDNPKMGLTLGTVAGAKQHFRGDLDDVRVYRRALNEAELQALIEPGRQFVKPPPARPQDLTLTLGSRQLIASLVQPAFAVIRLPAGPLNIEAKHNGMTGLERVVLTPLAPASELAQRFVAFEKRVPKLGVQLGLRRDCGSTFAPVGPPQPVPNTKHAKFVFEGAIRNFPSPDVEKDNVNYLAGVREIAVRSEYTDGRDMPRLAIRSVEFEGPYYEQWPPETHRNIFVSNDAKQVIRGFAAKAWRRPLAPAEEANLFAVYDKARAAGRSFYDGVKDALAVALTSPQFLFLIENSSSPKPEPLDGHELATKLSYFLWNAPPDATTRRLASTGALRAQLDAETDRLIADGRFTQFTREFVSQWLALDKFAVVEIDKKQYPKLTRDAKAHLKLEPIHFVEHLIRQNLPLRNLIDSDFIVADETTAAYYDLGAKTESGFNFVALPHGRKELGGLLTQAALLSGLSDGRESNPVKRGAWLARKIVAEPPDDPPPNVPALKEAEQGLTLRQRIEQHRNQTGCRQCHAKIDPWGVPFEEYDAGGRFKTQPVDAQSDLPDKTSVTGVSSLKKYLAEDRVDQVAFSVMKHLMIYATGRGLTYNELHVLRQDATKMKPTGYRMRDLVHYVVNSKPFLEK